MEKKTIEEMRSSVLAYCEELTSNWSVGVQVDIENLPNAYVSRRWSNGVFDAHFSGLTIAIDSDTKDSEFSLLYRILGLAERDAVAAERESMMKTVDALSAMVSVDPVAFSELQSRNTALVAALEEIRKPAMIIGFGKKATVKMRIDQLFEDHKRVRLIAKNALAANTEKGGVQG